MANTYPQLYIHIVFAVNGGCYKHVAPTGLSFSAAGVSINISPLQGWVSVDPCLFFYDVNTSDENTDTQMSDETEALPNETELLDLADAFLPDDVVPEETPAEDVQVSRFGLGPYPEIPKEWGLIPNYWEFAVDSIETELLSRVTIKMRKEGIRSKYGSVGINPSTGLIIPLERGSVLVEYDIDENGEKRIYSTLAHPDDLSPGMYTRFSEIPSHLKIVTADEIAFDPYEYLGISK